ncbi:DUF2309 domain-containing protein [Methylosarcina fibrata]|uniref:DUF2309 domain-containing protein n=1 Tax=Methylosarcina fibrata TaxID=105972 RepID=UPI0003A01594|nr:DUF2309 domain-containing protein [Methylosarcina fibrata]
MRRSLSANSNEMAALRDLVKEALQHLDHVLPGQGPILDFVHHNTLHGYQHLPFEEALAACEALTGVSGYLPEVKFREFYRNGRISEEDLSAALSHELQTAAEQVLLYLPGRNIVRKEIYRIALLYDLQAITVSQLHWNAQELNALDAPQADLPEPIRQQYRKGESGTPPAGIRPLWRSLLEQLELDGDMPHPENMLDLSTEQAEAWLNQVLQDTGENSKASIHLATRQHILSSLNELLDRIGESISLRGFIAALSGRDIFDFVRPQLIRICAASLDEGVAAWRRPVRYESGQKPSWREVLRYDANPFLHELPEWPQILQQLPADAVDAIVIHLSQLDIPQQKWRGYLQRLALELPGWSGMINWRQQHPEYRPAHGSPLTLADYLAIRLTLDRIWLTQVCRDLWKIEARLSSLEAYFRKNLSEFSVRRQLFQGGLPEYLTQQAQSLIERAGSERHERKDWQQLSDRIRTWQFSPMADSAAACSLNNQAWRLFRLSQHLGLGQADIDSLTRDDWLNLLKELDGFTAARRSKIWLEAYERNYRDHLFQAIRANQGRGRWSKRELRPEAQIAFCMDEREESFRRHLEELAPAVETLGAAGFFGIAMNYRGLDDAHDTPLCPVAIRPAHQVREKVKRGEESTLKAHLRGHRFFRWFNGLMHRNLRRELIVAYPKLLVLAPVVLIGLLADTIMPHYWHRLNGWWRRFIEPPVPTELHFQADAALSGFTDGEQADRVEGLLRTMGLTDGFAPFVCLIAHGSTSLNNPHEAAHDCGACGGRRGGPNARAFAAMANRREVRALLSRRGLLLPEDCWFIGAQHDTCDDSMIWYDLEAMPPGLGSSFKKILDAVGKAQQLSAHERCRRLLPAEGSLSPKAAYGHVRQRAADTSQVRPEYGHATNAAAFIGRRSATQGLFLDRRVFLISYDAAQDPEGAILETILLTAGPVGAGINLEYYFSTVDNERFGCGTKVPHNVTGLFGVMEGAASDLRTGLPWQMVEIHEAMRLQVIVEARVSVLEALYHRQPILRELVGGSWVHLSVVDPDTGDICVFNPGTGFVSWQASSKKPPRFASSPDYYRQQTGPLPPALILRPDSLGA